MGLIDGLHNVPERFKRCCSSLAPPPTNNNNNSGHRVFSVANLAENPLDLADFAST